MTDNGNAVGEETVIRKIVEDWAAAVRRRDLPAVLLNHSPDMLMFDVPPPFLSHGIDAYAKTWELFFAWARDPAVFNIKEMNITAGNDVAFVTAAMHCAGAEPGGEVADLDFRLTIGLRKIGGHWTIIHEHHSVPAD
jgi:ketosteroid isomerase-like protein